MSLHDKWMKQLWEKDPALIFTPAVISTAILCRMVDEGRITRQEFDVIESGYSYRMGELSKRLRAKTAELNSMKELRDE